MVYFSSFAWSFWYISTLVSRYTSPMDPLDIPNPSLEPFRGFLRECFRTGKRGCEMWDMVHHGSIYIYIYDIRKQNKLQERNVHFILWRFCFFNLFFGSCLSPCSQWVNNLFTFMKRTRFLPSLSTVTICYTVLAGPNIRRLYIYSVQYIYI